ncbi:MAG: hypothetical protein ILP10_02980, partial [Lachnospiraceae bacterium]|nr:hypothetical protein [Lachnospiraceae bacterium]
MDEKTAKKNHFFDITYITLTIIITGLGVLVFAVILMFLSGERAKSITFNRGWQVEYHGETFTNVDLNGFSFEDLKKADTIVIENTLPGNLPEDSCMMVHVHYHDILVELDGEEILAMDRDRYDRDEMLGSGFYIARIGSDGEGKNVRIVMRAGEDGALTSIETPSIWDYDTFYRDYASENVYKIALAFFFMVVGFSMTIMAVIVGLRKTFSAGDTFRLCSLSMFSVSFGTWMLGEQDLMEIFTTDTVRMAEMKYNALFLLPVFFIGFQFEESVDKRDKVKNSIFGIVWLIATGFSLFTYILHKTAGVNPRSFLLVSHVMDIGALLVVLVIRIKEIIRGRNRYKMSV